MLNVFDIVKFMKIQLYKFFFNPYLCRGLRKCGKKVFIEYGSYIAGRKHIEMGDNVYIGPCAIIYSTVADLYVGNHVTIGPRLTIITGDHRTDVIGCYMDEVHEKLPENDADVKIEDDVWIGANVTILKGVTIGAGAVIAAGAVVNKSIPPLKVAGGVPAKVICSRFSTHEDEDKQLEFYRKKLHPNITECFQKNYNAFSTDK